MGAQHQTQFVGFIQAEAKGRYFVQEHVEAYKRPDEIPFKTVSLRARKDNAELAKVRFQTLPGCCGVVLLHNFSGTDENIHAFLQVIRAAARRAKYGAVLYTLVQGHNVGGTTVRTFRNPKTGNNVEIFVDDTGAEHVPARVLEDR